MDDAQNKKTGFEAGKVQEWLKKKNSFKKPVNQMKQIRLPGARHRG